MIMWSVILLTILYVGHLVLVSERRAYPPVYCKPSLLLPVLDPHCMLPTACLLPRLEFWKHIGRYFPARVIKTTDLDPKEHYICEAGRAGGRYTDFVGTAGIKCV